MGKRFHIIPSNQLIARRADFLPDHLLPLLENTMKAQPTIVITGASQGIGAGLVTRFLERGYNVVATSRKISASTELPQSDRLLRVDGDIADPATAAKVVDAAVATFGSVDAL